MTVTITELPAEGMLLAGVALAGDGQRVTKSDLSLLFTAAGITVQATKPPGESLLAWAGLDGAWCQEQVALTDGRTAAILALSSGGQTIQFLLPSDTVTPGQVAYLGQALPAWFERYRVSSQPGVPPVGPAPAAPVAEDHVDAPWEAATGGVVGATAAAAAAAGWVAASSNGHGAAPPPAPSFAQAPPPAPSFAQAPPPAPSFAPTAPPPAPSFAQAPPPAPSFAPTASPPAPAPSPEWPLPPSAPPPTTIHSSTAEVPAVGAPTAWSVLPATTSADPAAPPADAFFTGYEPVVPAPAEPQAGPPSRTRKRTDRRWKTILIVLVVLFVILVGVAIYLLTRPSSTTTTASPATIALAKSINVRLGDLPAGWVQATAPAALPPPASPEAQLRAAQALATCVQQPATEIEGWLGIATFPGQITAVTSPTFQSGSSPIVQISSTTRVMASAEDAQNLASPFEARTFATCFGQYQAAAAAPVTAQVQTVALTAPPGVKAYGFVTTFTLSNQHTESVGDAFIVGGSVATVLQPSAAGPTIPSADFMSAYDAVAGRVARAAG